MGRTQRARRDAEEPPGRGLDDGEDRSKGANTSGGGACVGGLRAGRAADRGGGRGRAAGARESFLDLLDARRRHLRRRHPLRGRLHPHCAIADELFPAAPNPLYLQPSRPGACSYRDGKYDVSKLRVVTAEEKKGAENGRGSSAWVAVGEAVRWLVLRLMHGAPAPPAGRPAPTDPFWHSVRGKGK
ncbi:hypothetical protein DFJ74DRAFT_671953 [Hyaloraphidium curvatum]|nr:hypothetical protein DFJ74DRAFT_671953 [Hyaloraphidium curvatum]